MRLSDELKSLRPTEALRSPVEPEARKTRQREKLVQTTSGKVEHS